MDSGGNFTSSKQITVNPGDIKAFGQETASDFFLVTNRRFEGSFSIAASTRYRSCRVVGFDEGDSFERLLSEIIPLGSHILTILPDCLLESVDPQSLGHRKLLIMACRSGRTDLEGVEHFLSAGTAADPDDEERLANDFFWHAERSKYLKIVDKHGETCHFSHLSNNYEWHEQFGKLEWGQQQVFPSGEIACFVVPLQSDALPENLRFDLNGEMIVTGPMIVQSGPPSFRLEDQLRIHEHLSSASSSGVKLRIERGEVVHHSALEASADDAAQILSSLFHVDSRYRRVFELGFSISQTVKPWPGNTAMNEVWGESGGKLHLGLGMLPYTQYHLDLFCSGAHVVNDADQLVFGSIGMRRKRTGGCPCIAL